MNLVADGIVVLSVFKKTTFNFNRWCTTIHDYTTGVTIRIYSPDKGPETGQHVRIHEEHVK